MRFLNGKQIKANIEYDKLVKAKKICSACGQDFSKVKRSKRLDDVCEECEKAFD